MSTRDAGQGVRDLANIRSPCLVLAVNGDNGVSPDNRHDFDHISFGNNEATRLWRSITIDDIMITLGLASGQCSPNLSSIRVGHVWHSLDQP